MSHTAVSTPFAAFSPEASTFLQGQTEGGQAVYEVPGFAKAEPLTEEAYLRQASPLPQHPLGLSRFAYQRQHQGHAVLESPTAKFRITLQDWKAGALATLLLQGHVEEAAELFPEHQQETRQFLQLLWATRFLEVQGEEPESQQLWQFHSLLYHHHLRTNDFYAQELEKTSYPTYDTVFPVLKAPMSQQVFPLPVPDMAVVQANDITLTQAIETRQSTRAFNNEQPITLGQLGELLYRTARVMETYSNSERRSDVLEKMRETLDDGTAEFKEFVDYSQHYDTLTQRPYPSGGGMYELEIYPIVSQCDGLSEGIYHYDPENHQLERLEDPQGEFQQVSTMARQGVAGDTPPQVCFVMTARFGRLFWKSTYHEMGYGLILKHVGVLFQNLYLVANSMGLGACALGSGPGNALLNATGAEFLEESAVGEFIIGTKLPEAGEATPQGIESQTQEPLQTEGSVNQPVAAAEMAPQADETVQVSSQPEELVAEPEPKPALDLEERIPGLAALRKETKGHKDITVVVLDGHPDYGHSCFKGANVSKIHPYWHDAPLEISVEEYALFRSIDQNGKPQEERLGELAQVFDGPIMAQIPANTHATLITSMISGQEGSAVEGLAPRVRLITIPMVSNGNTEEAISVLNFTRAFELAMELEPHIIHCAVVQPTQTGKAHPMFERAVQNCLKRNILVVSPGGNDWGENWCLPAALPGVLAVGAINDEGRPLKMSNWGGMYQQEGIMTLGVEILGAQPGTEDTVRKPGTSAAAGVMSGVAALLMSLQLERTGRTDAVAVRRALLNTANACDPEVVEEPERCLRGVLNLPQTLESLFGGDWSSSIAPNGVNPSGAIEVGEAPLLGNPAIAEVIAQVDDDDVLPAELLAEIAAQAEAATPPAGEGTGDEAAPSGLDPDGQEPAGLDASGPRPIVYKNKIRPSLVYALGEVGYDFENEGRLEEFKALMPQVEEEGGAKVAPNPRDMQQMLAYLEESPEAANKLVWTLRIDNAPVYAIRPIGTYAPEVHERLRMMLAGHHASNSQHLERVCVPGHTLGDELDTLNSGPLPTLMANNIRGMYGWRTVDLVQSGLAQVATAGELADGTLQEAMTDFLNQVYHRLKNPGRKAGERALNFSVVNTYQNAAAFVQAVRQNFSFKAVKAVKSPYCRLRSNCWDVMLTFHDPENDRRGEQVYRYTIDVSARLPVTIGEVKSWAVPRPV